MFRCEVSMQSSAGGGVLLVGGRGFSGVRWDAEPMVDVSIESSVLPDLYLEERERVNVE